MMQALREAGRRVRTDPRLMWVATVVGFAIFYSGYFMPAWHRGALLAPGDGALYYLPFFLAPLQVWSPLMLSGYGVLGDPQAQTLYPIRFLTPTYNAYVVSAYVIAAIGTFGLALKLTRCRVASVGAALVMSGSGFMLSHLGHVSIIHAAAWVPAVLWSMAAVGDKREGWAIAAGAAACALCLLGGHPQISLIGLMLAGAFALHRIYGEWRERGHRAALSLALKLALVFALGAMLAAPMLVATLQSAADSVRGQWSRDDFDSYRHTVASLRLLFFPNLYGAITEGPYGGYEGPGSPSELSLYAGLLPIFLALAAFTSRQHRRACLFWGGMFLVSLLLALGTYTPLGELVFNLPIIGRFRAQARFGLVVVIALAILSAYGLAALLHNAPTRSRSRRLMTVSVLLCLVAVAAVAVAMPRYSEGVSKAWTQAGLWIAPAMMALTLGTFALLLRYPGGAMGIVVVAVMAVDVAHFGWFFDWRYGDAMSDAGSSSSKTAQLLKEMAGKEGRVLTVDGAAMTDNPLRPNLNLLHDIASVTGYTPLLPQRYARFAGVDTGGSFPSVSPAAPILDVLAVRWMAGGVNETETGRLGGDCGAPGAVRRMRAQLPLAATGTLRIVSHVGCAVHMPTGHQVAQVNVIGQDGLERASLPFRMGVETAEWAYDRPDVRAVVAHAKPASTESFDAGTFRGTWSIANIPLTTPADAPGMVEIALPPGLNVPLRIREVEFVDEKTGHAQRLSLTAGFPGAEQALGAVYRAPGMPPISERRDYRGMVWSVCHARHVPAEAIAGMLRTARGPEAGGLAVHREALVEADYPLPVLTCTGAPDVEVLNRSPGRWILRATASGEGLLVVSDRYDRGWRATVSGNAVPIVPVDGLILGVPVPNGANVVELMFRPRFFRSAVAASAVALVACVLLCILGWRGRRIGTARHVGTAPAMSRQRWPFAAVLVGACVVALAFLLATPRDRELPATQRLPTPSIPIDTPVRFDMPDVSGPIHRVTGFSAHEPWGRWTDGATGAIEFDRPLPPQFKLRIEIEAALSPTIRTGALIRVGTMERPIPVHGGPEVFEVSFGNTTSSRRIELIIPDPRSPRELGLGNDNRLLGLGVRAITVVPDR